MPRGGRVMDAEQLRLFLLGLPHVEETLQWGENLVFWVGDKAIGGRMFALVDLRATSKAISKTTPKATLKAMEKITGKATGGPVLSFPAGAERYAELLEREGLVPAPYFARIGWVALERWDAVPARELREWLHASHAAVLGRLSKKTRAVLALPAGQRREAIAAARQLSAGKSAIRSAAKSNLRRRS